MGTLSLEPSNADARLLELVENMCPFHKEIVADLLVIHIHLKIRLGISDEQFYERLSLTLTACRREHDPGNFLRYFIRQMGIASGKEMSDIARLLQGSLLLKEDRLKVVTLPFWKETFAHLERDLRP